MRKYCWRNIFMAFTRVVALSCLECCILPSWNKDSVLIFQVCVCGILFALHLQVIPWNTGAVIHARRISSGRIWITIQIFICLLFVDLLTLLGRFWTTVWFGSVSIWDYIFQILPLAWSMEIRLGFMNYCYLSLPAWNQDTHQAAEDAWR